MPIFSFLIAFFCLACGQEENTPDRNEPKEKVKTFKNPVLPKGADPWVIQKDGVYYYTHTKGKNIELRSTKCMEDLSASTPVTVWYPPGNEDYSKQIWAPELHFLDGKWYIYFAATFDSGEENSLNENRRMFVLENSSSSPMNHNWIFKGKLTDRTDRWAIDGTVFEMGENRYFIWSGWRSSDHASNTGRQQLYIAEMINPWLLEGERVMISEPTFEWEQNGLVNEGPVILKNNEGKVFLVYSACGCWTDDYKLGILAFEENADPLNSDAWVKHQHPMFAKNVENKVYAPGHNSFFKSPDGREDWLLYHANDNPGDGCGGLRSPRVQKFTWTAEGFPVFGIPASTAQKLAVPSANSD